MVRAGKKIDFKFKRDWPVLIPIVPLFLFTIITPYFGLYEYLIPLGLHEWAGENFQDFFRSLDEYSDNPMRDKVMYSWVTLLGVLFGLLGGALLLMHDELYNTKFYARVTKGRDVEGMRLALLGLLGGSIAFLLFLGYIWLIFHYPTARNGFRFDDTPYYFWCCMCSFMSAAFISSFFYSCPKYYRARNI